MKSGFALARSMGMIYVMLLAATTTTTRHGREEWNDSSLAAPSYTYSRVLVVTSVARRFDVLESVIVSSHGAGEMTLHALVVFVVVFVVCVVVVVVVLFSVVVVVIVVVVAVVAAVVVRHSKMQSRLIPANSRRFPLIPANSR
jgi:Flp pilus assembly protein TadB